MSLLGYEAGSIGFAAGVLIAATALRLRDRHKLAGTQALSALEATGDGIYALDPYGRCTWSNAAAAHILGYSSPSAYIGRQMHDLIHHTRADGTPFPESECSGLKNLRAGRGVAQPQELLWRADGSSFYAEVRTNPMLKAGKLLGAVVVFRDLSERLRREEQHRQMQKLETVGLMAAGVAHDFNNLLTVINGYAEIAQQAPGLDSDTGKHLAAIRHAGLQASALTRQLVELSRGSSSAGEILQLNEVIRAAERLLRSVLGETNVLELDLAPDLEPVGGIRSQVEQMLFNLIANARDAMRDGGRAIIRTSRLDLDAAAARARGCPPGGYVALTVIDTGVGMDAATRSRMFEPFFTTKPPSQGTGLGLATVHAAVRRNGGAIAVTSEPGQGTSVQICLPVLGAASGVLPSRASAASCAPIQ